MISFTLKYPRVVGKSGTQILEHPGRRERDARNQDIYFHRTTGDSRGLVADMSEYFAGML